MVKPTEETVTMPSDKGAERYLIGVIVFNDDSKLLNRLDVKDFHDGKYRFLFKELRLLNEAGYPMGRAGGFSRWFSSNEYKRRAEKEGFTESPVAMIADVMRDYVTAAHADFYVRIVKKERLRRMLAWVSVQLKEKNDGELDEPIKTIEWLQQVVNQIWEKAHDSFPEKMEIEA